MKDKTTDIQNLKLGNKIAFEKLYIQHSGKLYNFVMSISNGDSYLAEEMVQSVFIKIWEKREELDENKSFDAFLCTIAKHKVLNYYRHQLLESLYQKNYAKRHHSVSNSTEEDVDLHCISEDLLQIIQTLPPIRKKVFIMSRLEQITNKKIAEKLSISENTVISHLSKANVVVRQAFKKLYKSDFILIISLLFFDSSI